MIVVDGLVRAGVGSDQGNIRASGPVTAGEFSSSSAVWCRRFSRGVYSTAASLSNITFPLLISSADAHFHRPAS